MNNADALLYPLFHHLHQAGVPLGISDYLLLLKTLRAGYGLEDEANLKFVCQLLWTKSREDLELFDQAFDYWVKPRLRLTPLLSSSMNESSDNVAAERSQDEYHSPSVLSSGEAMNQEKVQQGGVQSGVLPHDLDPAHTGNNEDVFSAKGKYQLTPRLPMTKREMVSIWRHLRQMRRDGPAVELDVHSTLDTLCRQGYLLHPVLRPLRSNQTRLLILVDRRGSMLPFVQIVDALLESIRSGGLLGATSTYYFHNCPGDYLSPHPGLIQHHQLHSVLAEAAKEQCVLIVSDAGAARGVYRQTRVQKTKGFLSAIQSYTHRYAWLNPLPKERWLGTTAAAIAALAPMFPLTRDGLIDTVNVLRGQLLAQGGHPHGEH